MCLHVAYYTITVQRDVLGWRLIVAIVHSHQQELQRLFAELDAHHRLALWCRDGLQHGVGHARPIFAQEGRVHNLDDGGNVLIRNELHAAVLYRVVRQIVPIAVREWVVRDTRLVDELVDLLVAEVKLERLLYARRVG